MLLDFSSIPNCGIFSLGYCFIIIGFTILTFFPPLACETCCGSIIEVAEG